MTQASIDDLKRLAASKAAEEVTDGMIVGLGTGSTAFHVVEALGKRVASGLRIIGIPTSEDTAAHARKLGIPVSDLGTYSQIDLTIDGADEVELGTLNLIKGHGGALLREKIVATASRALSIVVDETKLVEHLGSRFAVPVEAVPFGWQTTADRVSHLGTKPERRLLKDGEPFLTDGGHYILDCAFPAPIASAATLDGQLKGLVGVVEHGLFLNMASKIFVGSAGGVQVIARNL